MLSMWETFGPNPRAKGRKQGEEEFVESRHLELSYL